MPKSLDAPDADWLELSRGYWPTSGGQSGLYNTAMETGLCHIASSHFMHLKKTISKQNVTFVLIMKKSLYLFTHFIMRIMSFLVNISGDCKTFIKL